jgi:hypothetical protein
VAYLLKARIVKAKEEPLLGNDSVRRKSAVIVGSDIFPAVHTKVS